MPAVEIELGDDEDIIRVYTRYPNEWRAFSKLLAKDFARIMASHSGISLWRLNYCTRDEAMAALKTRKRTGTAISKAKVLKGLGMGFFGSKSDDAHVSARCLGCDMNINYKKELCQKLDGTDCGLKLEAEFSMCETLINKRIFNIDLAIS